MEQRALGTGGLKLSIIGIGTNNFGMKIDEAASASVVNAALDAGINHFDTAEVYGGGKSEEFLGNALGGRRSEAVIATKFAPRPADQTYTPGSLAARINEGVEISLRHLGTDYIDLYYQHQPDADAPMDEVLETLDALVQAGKVLHIASSNFSPEQVHAAATVSATKSLARFGGAQIHWSLLSRDVEAAVVPAAAEAGLGVVPYFPLASGMLTGKYHKGEAFPEGSRLAMMTRMADLFASDAQFDKVEAYAAFAADHDRPLNELATGWLLAQPTVTSVICGATTPEQVVSNASTWLLTPEEAAAVAAI
jgi:aryl-alcohol dehydrogenase-like predicted oxidoreductase